MEYQMDVYKISVFHESILRAWNSYSNDILDI
jgi:hypothetical protein